MTIKTIIRRRIPRGKRKRDSSIFNRTKETGC